MVTNQSSIDSIETVAQPARLRRGRWFLPGLTSTLLAAVLAGFAPTFYLRPLFHHDTTLPMYLIVHGIILTAWYGMLVAQSFLVATGRTNLHRRFGVSGAIIAGLVVPVGLLVTARMVPAGLAAGREPNELGIIVIANALNQTVFTAFVTAAMVWRRKFDWHKRLLVAASVMISMPALGRLHLSPAGTLVLFLGLLAALWLYDHRTLGRIHRATVVVTVVMMADIVTLLALLQTPAVQAVVNALK